MKASVFGRVRAGSVGILLLVLISSYAAADELTVSGWRDTSSTWSDSGRWAVKLRFNHPVFPSNLGQSLDVTADAAQKPYKLLSWEAQELTASPVKEMLVVSAIEKGRPQTIRVVVKKGLSDVSGRRLLSKSYTVQFRSVDEIMVTGVSTYYRSPKDKGLTVSLSGSVSERDFARNVEIRPEVPDLQLTREHGWSHRISGSFELNKDYVIEIKSGPVDDGNALISGKIVSFKGPGLKPEVTPRTKRSVVELFGRQLFPVTLSNVTKVRCELQRVPPFLIPELAAAVAATGTAESVELEKRAAELKKVVETGKIKPVFAGEASTDSDVFFAPEAKDHVLGYSLPLSFREQPDRGGALLVRLSDPDSGSSIQVRNLVQVTDLSVSYKLSATSLLVWVTSIHTGEPVADAEVLLFASDGTRFLVGKTNRDGVVMVKDGQMSSAVLFTAPSPPSPANQPLALSSITWIVAANRSDACGVDLRTLRFEPQAVTQAKQVRGKPDAVRGQVFTERGVYRPGETVHFKYVSRAYRVDRIAPPAGSVVTVEIVGPTQDVPYSKDLTLSEFGTCYDSFVTKKFFPVGTYQINVHARGPGDAKEVFTHTFMIQEYKRARHFATLSLKALSRKSKAYIGMEAEERFLDVEVSGQYYTGGPVKNGRVRWKATLVPAVNKIPQLSGYFSGNEDSTTRFLESGESTLDRNGKLHVLLPLDSRLLTGIYGVNLSATVLDVDGEPATDVQTFSPQLNFMVGISRHPEQVQTGYEAPLKIVVVDKDGKKITSGSVDASVMELDTFYVQKRDESGNINYLWEEGWIKTVSATVPITKGEATFPVSLHRTGRYLIAFTYVKDDHRYASQTVFQVGWRGYDEWVRTREEKEAQTSNQVFLTMNKQLYKVGEEVDVHFQTPRPVKKCLVSLESGEILDYRVIDADGPSIGYRFSVKEQYLPNVYVSVIVAAGRGDFPVYTTQTDSDIPSVYFGYADISVSSTSQKLELEIAPGITDLKGRPGEKKTLTFKVRDDKGKGTRSEMAVCVVDEAVLALTRFQTPSLESLTRFNLPLAVFSGDLRLDLVSQDLFRVLSTKPLIGGDGAAGAMSASLRKDFRPVAYYNPAVHTDESGEASVELTLPDTTTAYRVYAVVCDKGSAFASGERSMVVTKEFFVEPSVPRFLVPGDRATFPVVLHNKTKEKGDFKLAAEGSPLVSVRLDEDSGSLAAWSTLAVKATTEVTSGTESARLLFKGTFTGEAGSFSDAIENTCPVLSRFLPVHSVEMGDFVQHRQIMAKLPDSLKSLSRSDLHPDDFKAILTVGTANWSKIAPGLKYVLHYPWGCVEQTSSGVIPLAGIRGLVSSGVIPGLSLHEVDKFLKGGVDRLLGMQVAQGGFSYWPGQQDPSWWGTMYASFALIMAKKAGFDVPQERLDKALDYLRKHLFDEKADKLHGWSWTRELAAYILALHKRLDAQELETFFKRYDDLGNQSKGLLLLAAHHIGYLPKKEVQDRLSRLDPRFDPSRVDYDNSSTREIAVCLLAAMDVGGAPKKAQEWAGYLIRTLRPEGAWYSTADTGWCLLALTRFYDSLRTKKRGPIKITVDYAGHEPVDVTVADATAYVPLDVLRLLEAGSINLRCDTKLMVNYTLELTYPDMAAASAAQSTGFTLHKRMENLNGKDEIRVGDVVRVTLDIGLGDSSRSTYDKRFHYLALVDPVPAGLVPINSELKSEGVETEDSGEREGLFSGVMSFTPNHMEFRDDGVRVFKDRAWSGPYRYSYLARAVMEGDFWMRSSRISLMYDPECFGRTEGKRIQILPVK